MKVFRHLLPLASALALFAFVTPFTLAETWQRQSQEERTGLIELYTSEGCSSCPPADQWFSSLKNHPGLWQDFIPVAFHVDYWDYIGWNDPFAQAEYGQRQRLHRSQGNSKSVYTPGFFVDGKEWRGWFNQQKSIDVKREPIGTLNLAIDGKKFEAQFKAASSPASSFFERTPQYYLHIAQLGFDLSTTVKAGENRGKTLKHDFVVLSQKRYPLSANQWQGEVPANNPGIIAKRYAWVAWISEKNNIRPIQSVGGWQSQASP